MSAATGEAVRQQQKLDRALATVREALAPGQVLVLCPDDMYVSSQVQHSSGTFQVTCKRRTES